MLRILVTNDDGYRSAGIHALAGALGGARRGDDRGAGDRSERDRPRAHAAAAAAAGDDGAIACSPSTARRPTASTSRSRMSSTACPTWSSPASTTDGTSATTSPIRGRWPGALEGALLGIPSIAVSLRQTRGDYDFSCAARAAAVMAEAMLRAAAAARTFLNINVPKGEPKGYRVTVQAKRNHVTSVAERHDPKGQPVLLDRRRAERVGAARSVGLSGGPRRLRVGHAAAS